jgi:hypothetical protein
MKNNKTFYCIICLVSIIILLWSLFGKKIEKYQNSNITPFPIDIVYTWTGEKFTNDIRTSYNNELQYSLRSIIEYAPWVNHIYILMNSPKKTPSWFNDNYKDIITIYGHDEIFPKHIKAPNTNSNVIETTIHTIPNLTEHFIYFNDDLFLGKLTKYTDFFTNDGKIVLPKNYFIDNKINLLKKDKEDILKIKYPKYTSKAWQYHIPFPLRKKYIKEFHNEYKDYIYWIQTESNDRRYVGCNVCTKYNLHCPCQHTIFDIQRYMYDKNMVYSKEMKDFDKNWYNLFEASNILNLDINKFINNKPLFYCMNDTEENPNKREPVKEKLNLILENFYPVKPYFEK